MELRTALRDDPSEVGRVRHLVTDGLDRWGVPDEKGVAALLVSELVTNALRYGEQPIRLLARRAGGAVRVEVHDGCPGDPPRVREPLPESTTGRGLLLVDALAARWGWSAFGGSKQVWFELDA